MNIQSVKATQYCRFKVHYHNRSKSPKDFMYAKTKH